MAAESEKYPPKIRKLFTPKLPFLHKRPIDYPPNERATPAITPVSSWKSEIEKYRQEFQSASTEPPRVTISKRKAHLESLKRQLYEWEDTDAFAKNDFIKDPYKTVFVARLYYSLTELDLSKHFNKYGTIESVRIIRNNETGHSRGYGFIVFEREADAKNCIRELAPTGLAIDPPSGDSKPRKILVDMERGRLARNWRPRRLGGGLGGRHYTSSTALSTRDASAASSGRRLNLSSNPYPGNSPQSSSRNKRPNSDFHSGPNKRHHNVHDSYRSNAPAAPKAFAYSSTSSYAQPSSYVPTSSYSSISPPDRHGDQLSHSMKDKYARYQSGNQESSYKPSSSGSGRSIRSIRQNE